MTTERCKSECLHCAASAFISKWLEKHPDYCTNIAIADILSILSSMLTQGYSPEVRHLAIAEAQKTIEVVVKKYSDQEALDYQEQSSRNLN